jgi:hypothetical protein
MASRAKRKRFEPQRRKDAKVSGTPWRLCVFAVKLLLALRAGILRTSVTLRLCVRIFLMQSDGHTRLPCLDCEAASVMLAPTVFGASRQGQ